MTSRIPVTVLTGFLGSGKTTLVNRILSEQHGRRIAVIENEFGEVGIDHELVIGAQEEIFETSNGCICCTVRGDLIRILTQLRKRRDRFDAILIETTGLADPGPVAQTFFVDEDLREHFLLDAIVTLVDARHAEQQLQTTPIAQEQVAFADLILLNKVDLVDQDVLARVERTVRAINGTARLLRTRRADAPLEQVLNVGAFDLERALARDQAFLEPPRPFEWAALYPASPSVTLRTNAARGDHAPDHAHNHDQADDHDHGHDEAHGHGLGHVDLVWLPAPANAAGGATGANPDEQLAALLDAATRAFDGELVQAETGAPLRAGTRYRLRLGTPRAYRLAPAAASAPASCALFTEHAPEEFGMALDAPLLLQRNFGSHHHDVSIGSIGLTEPRPLDAAKVNEWLSYLLQSRGQDILRMKGVLQFKDEPRRYVFHGVHMVFEGQLERPWGGLERCSRLVFIGRALDRAELEAGLESCLAR